MKTFLVLLTIATVVQAVLVTVKLENGDTHFQMKHRNGPPLNNDGTLLKGKEGDKSTQVLSVVSVKTNYDAAEPNKDSMQVTFTGKVKEWKWNVAQDIFVQPAGNADGENKSGIKIKGKLVNGELMEFKWDTNW